MSKMNYRKASLHSRVRYEEREYGRQTADREWGDRNRKLQRRDFPKERWIKSPLPKHKGLTFPEIFFRDLQYLLWFVDNHQKRNSYEVFVANRVLGMMELAKNIGPPKAGQEFLIIDSFKKSTGEAKLKTIRVVARGTTPNGLEKYRIRRRRFLSVDIIKEYADSSRAQEKFLRCLEKAFFKGEKPSAQQCMKFFDTLSDHE